MFTLPMFTLGIVFGCMVHVMAQQCFFLCSLDRTDSIVIVVGQFKLVVVAVVICALTRTGDRPSRRNTLGRWKAEQQRACEWCTGSCCCWHCQQRQRLLDERRGRTCRKAREREQRSSSWRTDHGRRRVVAAAVGAEFEAATPTPLSPTFAGRGDIARVPLPS